jgi:hypothetical protein
MATPFNYSTAQVPQQENAPDLVRWMIEIDDFVRQVSDELTAIGMELGQASDIPEFSESREQRGSRTAQQDRSFAEDHDSRSPAKHEASASGSSRLQSIRERLTRMTNPSSDTEPARHSREQG